MILVLRVLGDKLCRLDTVNTQSCRKPVIGVIYLLTTCDGLLCAESFLFDLRSYIILSGVIRIDEEVADRSNRRWL